MVVRYIITVSDIEFVKIVKKILIYGLSSLLLILTGIAIMMSKVVRFIPTPPADLALAATSLLSGLAFLFLLNMELSKRRNVKTLRKSLFDEIKYQINLYREKKSLVEIYEKWGLKR